MKCIRPGRNRKKDEQMNRHHSVNKFMLKSFAVTDWVNRANHLTYDSRSMLVVRAVGGTYGLRRYTSLLYLHLKFC